MFAGISKCNVKKKNKPEARKSLTPMCACECEHVCAYIQVYMCGACVNKCIWKPVFDIGCLIQLLNPLFF